MGVQHLHAARVRTVTEAQKLTPFARAYFKRWRTYAEEGSLGDIDELEKAYKRGDVTDAELLKQAPKSWRSKLPALETQVESTAAATNPIESGNYGFSEELASDIAQEKLLGHNFIDDGNLLESDGQDPGTKVRAQLVKMDALALEIRKGLNGLVREGIGMVEEASQVDLGEGTETLAAMKPVLGRLMTAYTELVAGLQKARESVGYDVEGPSVTSVPDEGEMQERITKRFARRATHGYLRESAAGGAEVYATLSKMQKDPIKCDELAQNVAVAINGLADALFDALYSSDLTDVKKSLKRHITMIPKELHKSPALNIEKIVTLLASMAKEGSSDAVRAEAKRLRQVATEIEAASHARMVS